MNKLHLKQNPGIAKYPATRAKSLVMAQAWFLSMHCRLAVRGHGPLREASEDRK